MSKPDKQFRGIPIVQSGSKYQTDAGFSAIKNGVMRLEPAQFEALFAGLDWRRVWPLEVVAPAVAE